MPLFEQVQELNIDMGNMKSYFHNFENIIIYFIYIYIYILYIYIYMCVCVCLI